MKVYEIQGKVLPQLHQLCGGMIERGEDRRTDVGANAASKDLLQVDTETHAAVTGVYEEAFTWKYDSETLASAHSITLLTGAGYTDAASRGKGRQI